MEAAAAVGQSGDAQDLRPHRPHSASELGASGEEEELRRQSRELDALRTSLGMMCLRTDRLCFENTRLNQENAALRSCLAVAEHHVANVLLASREQVGRLPGPARPGAAEEAAPIGYIWEDACTRDSLASPWLLEDERVVDSPPSPPLRRPLPKVPRSWLEAENAGARLPQEAAKKGAARENDERRADGAAAWSLPATVSPGGGKVAMVATHGGILCEIADQPAQPAGGIRAHAGSLRDITNARPETGAAAWARASAAAPRCGGRPAVSPRPLAPIQAVPASGGRATVPPPAPAPIQAVPCSGGHERSSRSALRAISMSGLHASSPGARSVDGSRSQLAMPKASPYAVARSFSFVPPACSSSHEGSGSFAPPARLQASERPTPRPVLLGNASLLRSSPAKKPEAARSQTAKSSRARAQPAPAPAPTRAIAAAKASDARQRHAAAVARQPRA